MMANLTTTKCDRYYKECVTFLASLRTNRVRQPPPIEKLEQLKVTKQQRPIIQYILTVSTGTKENYKRYGKCYLNTKFLRCLSNPSTY